MFDIMKAVRETAAARSAVTRARRPRPELIRLRVEIERTKCAIEAARNHFEQAVDPTLIDCYIYELNAAQLRYQFLLRKFKSQEDEYSQYYPPPGAVTYDYIKIARKTT